MLINSSCFSLFEPKLSGICRIERRTFERRNQHGTREFTNYTAMLKARLAEGAVKATCVVPGTGGFLVTGFTVLRIL